jgi:hypothetical protein
MSLNHTQKKLLILENKKATTCSHSFMLETLFFIPLHNQKNVMQEFILILVAIFVLFKIFGRPTVIYFNQHHHNHQASNKPKVDIHHNKKNKGGDEGEYVDYEEIK